MDYRIASSSSVVIYLVFTFYIVYSVKEEEEEKKFPLWSGGNYLHINILFRFPDIKLFLIHHPVSLCFSCPFCKLLFYIMYDHKGVFFLPEFIFFTGANFSCSSNLCSSWFTHSEEGATADKDH